MAHRNIPGRRCDDLLPECEEEGSSSPEAAMDMGLGRDRAAVESGIRAWCSRSTSRPNSSSSEARGMVDRRVVCSIREENERNRKAEKSREWTRGRALANGVASSSRRRPREVADGFSFGELGDECISSL